MNGRDQTRQTFVTSFCPICDRTSLFTDHKISGLPIRAKYSHVKIYEQTVDNSPTDPISSTSNWWSSIHEVATLHNCWEDLFTSSQYLSTHFFAWPSMSQDHEDIMHVSRFPEALGFWNFSVPPAEILDSNILLLLSTIPCVSYNLFECNPNKHGQSTSFKSIFHIGLK